MNIFDKMVLGTAQFGSHYGIANSVGKLKKKEILSILDLAWEKGVRRFDTAPAYGTEKILGEFIKVNGLKNKIKILTKIPPFNNLNDSIHLNKNIENSLNDLDCLIEVLFFHKASDSYSILNKPDYFIKLMEKYKISNIGVSVYNPREVKIFDKLSFPLSFQFPYNLLDRRFKKVIKSKGMRYARSIFLQGVLISREHLQSQALNTLKKLHEEYHLFLQKNNIDPLRFALSYTYSSDDLDFFLIGVDNKEQFNQLVDIDFDLNLKKHLELINNFKFKSKLLDPRTWNC